MWQRGAEIQYLPAKALSDAVRTDSQRWAVIAKATGARASRPCRADFVFSSRPIRSFLTGAHP